MHKLDKEMFCHIQEGGISLPLKQLLGIILVLNKKPMKDRVSFIVQYACFLGTSSSGNYL